jgi:hypothetical protein
MLKQPVLPLLLMIIFPIFLHSQEMISGKIFSAKDSIALEGVSVYFDGTSMGTVSGKTGAFRIESNRSGTAPLVISFLGFENAIIEISENTTKLSPIYLKEKEEMLGEVIIEPDPWSREKKMRIFRREFLGTSHAAADSKIKNEDAIKLYFSPTKKELSAQVSEPLEIVNKHLGYRIFYDVTHFEVKFLNSPNAIRSLRMVRYEGTSFFEELRKRTRKKHRRNREITYKGSPLHFMRSLATQKLRENRFRIFHESFETEPYKFFNITKENGLTRVKLLTDKLSILYYDVDQSGIQTKSEFSIDQLGNHTPPMAVIFTGEMSYNRVADMLPINYFPEDEKQ